MRVSAVLLIAGSLAGPGTAMAAPDVAPTISASGQGSWEMICHIAAGDQSDRILGPDRSSYSSPKLQRASCSYKGASGGPLVITITGPTACPFKGASADACMLSVPKGRAGSFELNVRPAR